MDDMNAKTTRLYGARAAVKYLSKKLGHEVKLDTFYHMVHRGTIPVENILGEESLIGGEGQGRQFSQETLDAIGPIRRRATPKLHQKETIPVISTNIVMTELAEKHGEIIDFSEALKIIREKDPNISESNARQHLLAHVGPVGRTKGVGKYHSYYYSKRDVTRYVVNEHTVSQHPRHIE